MAVGGMPGMAVPFMQYQLSPAAIGVTGKHNAGDVGVMMAGCRVPTAINGRYGAPKLTTGRKIFLLPGSVAPATSSKHSREKTIFENFMEISICIVYTSAGQRRKFGIKKRVQPAQYTQNEPATFENQLVGLLLNHTLLGNRFGGFFDCFGVA